MASVLIIVLVAISSISVSLVSTSSVSVSSAAASISLVSVSSASALRMSSISLASVLSALVSVLSVCLELFRATSGCHGLPGKASRRPERLDRATQKACLGTWVAVWTA